MAAAVQRRRQLSVALDNDEYEQLEAAANAARHSIAEEIRRQLRERRAEKSFELPTQNLVDKIRNLTTAVRIQTNHAWHTHPAAVRVLRRAINMALARIAPGVDPDEIDRAEFAPGELPTFRFVAQGSDDPDVMGAALEAVVHHTGGWPAETQQSLIQSQAEEAKMMRAAQSKSKGKKR